MKIIKSELLAFGIILVSFFIGFYFYQKMPKEIASHWNIEGRVNGYISRFWGIFLVPFISLLIFLLFVAIPKIDPLRSNINKFRKNFDTFIIITLIFLLYIHILIIIWNLGIKFDIRQFLAPAFTVLFYYLGALIENSKRNWFIGIRTPWTMSSDEVWRITHKLGGKLFKISAVIAFFGFIFPTFAIYLFVIPVILSSIFIIIYSYFEYQNLKKSHKK